MLAGPFSRVREHKGTAFICCSRYLRTPRSASFEACGIVRPRSAPQNLSPTCGAGRSGDADLRVFQRLWINPIAPDRRGPPQHGGAPVHRAVADLQELFRQRPNRPASRLASPSLTQRGSIVGKEVDLQVFKPSPGFEPGAASLPWRFPAAREGRPNSVCLQDFPATDELSLLVATLPRRALTIPENPQTCPQDLSPDDARTAAIVGRIGASFRIQNVWL
jgi:hypothetical protein